MKLKEILLDKEYAEILKQPLGEFLVSTYMVSDDRGSKVPQCRELYSLYKDVLSAIRERFEKDTCEGNHLMIVDGEYHDRTYYRCRKCGKVSSN